MFFGAFVVIYYKNIIQKERGSVMQIGGFDNIQFRPGTHPSVEAKAAEVIGDVNNVAGKLMSVDDRVDIDMNGRMGEVKVNNLSFNDAPGERISGKLSFDPVTHEKKELYAEVKDKSGILSSPKVILEYDKDYQSIPIFGSKKERFEKRTQDDYNSFKSLVQIVDINPKTGLAEYSEYIQDNTPMPTPDPFPNPGPFPHPNPHPGPSPHPSPNPHPSPGPSPHPSPNPHPSPSPHPSPGPHSNPGGGFGGPSHGPGGGFGGPGGPGHSPGGPGGPGGHRR
jgi:hypothetical protein